MNRMELTDAFLVTSASHKRTICHSLPSNKARLESYKNENNMQFDFSV